MKIIVPLLTKVNVCLYKMIWYTLALQYFGWFPLSFNLCCPTLFLRMSPLIGLPKLEQLDLLSTQMCFTESVTYLTLPMQLGVHLLLFHSFSAALLYRFSPTDICGL